LNNCNRIDNGFDHVDLVMGPVRRPEQAAQLPDVPERVPENLHGNWFLTNETKGQSLSSKKYCLKRTNLYYKKFCGVCYL
jgi:hypothetical protein